MTASRLLFFALLSGACPAFAQTKTPAQAPAKATAKSTAKAPGGFTYSAANLVYRSNGVRLEGSAARPARVQSPQLDVAAQVIAFDVSNNTISQVRAQNGVNLKLNLALSAGGAPARVEATCDNAVLTPGTRQLVLTGHLKGFYQIAGGARTTLSGNAATLTYSGGNLLADLSGGANGVSLNIPAELTGSADALGDVTITAQRARINQSTGVATFSGRARAVSKGTNAFDVSAGEFILTRDAGGAIATLKTTGRTLAKLDLPPDPAPVGATNAGTNGVGKPTHVEVAADGALIERGTSTATFDGNVQGFYRLAPAGTAPQNYDFAGNRAVLRYVPTANATGNALAGLSVQVTGAQVEGPAFNFGF